MLEFPYQYWGRSYRYASFWHLYNFFAFFFAHNQTESKSDFSKKVFFDFFAYINLVTSVDVDTGEVGSS